MSQSVDNKPSINFVETGSKAFSNIAEAASSLGKTISPVGNVLKGAGEGLAQAAKFGLGAAITLMDSPENFVDRTLEIVDTAQKRFEEGLSKDKEARKALAEDLKGFVCKQIQEVRDGVCFHADDIRASLTNTLIERADKPIVEGIEKLPIAEDSKQYFLERYTKDSTTLKITREESISQLNQRTAEQAGQIYQDQGVNSEAYQQNLATFREEKLAIQKEFAAAYTTLSGTYNEAINRIERSAYQQIRRYSQSERDSGKVPAPDKQQIGRAISDSRANNPKDFIQGLASRIAPAFFREAEPQNA